MIGIIISENVDNYGWPLKAKWSKQRIKLKILVEGMKDM